MSGGHALVGRDDELAQLTAALVRALDADGGVVLVHGEAGIGKTALVRAAVDTLPAGVTVLVGGCDPLSTPRPLGPLHDVVVGLGDDVRRRLNEAEARHEVFAAVHDRLHHSPHVLVVEDAHWADEATLDLLRYLSRRVAGTHSSLVVTYRDTELDDRHPLRAVLGNLVRSGNIIQVHLTGLSLDAVASLVAGTGLIPEAVHERTGGNAFFVSEVAAQPDVPVPDNVRDAVLARTAYLDDTAHHVLRLLACLPGSLRADGLAALRIEPDSLTPLVAAGLLARHGGDVRFTHELTRLTVFDAIPASHSAALHRELLDALGGTAAGDPALLAHLARHAERPRDVVRFGRSAAREAARAGAHREAAAFLEGALRACEPDERADLLEALSYEHYHVDRIADAIAAHEEALALRRAVGQWPAVGADLRWLSRLHWFAGDRLAAERQAGEAIDVLTDAGDEAGLGFAYGHRATLEMTRGDPSGARAWGDRAIAIADRLDLAELRAQMLTTLGMADLISGDDAGIAKIRESVAIAGRLRLDEHAARALNNLAFFLVEARRYREATEILDEGMGFTAARDLDTFHLYFLGMRARLRLALGHWTAAWDDATQVLATDPAPLHAVWPLLVRGLLRLRRGDPDSRPLLDEAWAVTSGFGEHYRMVPVAAALAEHEWLTGDAGDSAERLTGLAETLPPAPNPWLAGEIAAWLRRLGARAPEGLDPAGTPYGPALAGDTEAAVAAWSALGTPYERALTLIDAGTAESLLAALDPLDEVGASRTGRYVRRRLRQHGVATPRGPRRTTRANPAGLTARQVDVLRLLGDGLTNAEIARRLYISEKTAGHHVSAILTKLDVADRRQAAAVGREAGLVG